ncbi:MAG: alpha/beta hydrolase [Terricaulis sp.]
MNPDLEAEYNNRARVPEHPGIIASWAADSSAYRDAKTPQLVRYGAGERNVMDVFEAGPGAPLAMFIHGGYWQALDKSFFSHIARGLNARGVSVAVPSYSLCPNVCVGDIVKEMRTACAWLHHQYGNPVLAFGHSAGGHLSACLLATEAHVPAAYAISGLFDLTPLVETSINGALQMDEPEADNLSPVFWPGPAGKTLDAVVGGAESSEYLGQSRAIVEAWAEDDVTTRYEEIAGANHFTVIAPLADRNSSMCVRLEELARSV